MSTVICARPGQEAVTVQTGLVSVWKQSVSLSNHTKKGGQEQTQDDAMDAQEQAARPALP